MITVKCFVLNPIAENCYVVSDPTTREGVIVDCGAFDSGEFSRIEEYISSEGITLRHALQTHMHFDHVFGLDLLHERYGLQPECHTEEQTVYADGPRLARELCGVALPLPRVGIGGFLEDGQVIPVGNAELKVIHTPGHTPGGLCFYIGEADGILLSGDTLFQGSVGRTDVPQGSWRALLQSLRAKLLTLPPETVVYPGHGPSTTIAYERQYNPYRSPSERAI